jgi:hypothetical protein
VLWYKPSVSACEFEPVEPVSFKPLRGSLEFSGQLLGELDASLEAILTAEYFLHLLRELRMLSSPRWA